MNFKLLKNIETTYNNNNNNNDNNNSNNNKKIILRLSSNNRRTIDDVDYVTKIGNESCDAIDLNEH